MFQVVRERYGLQLLQAHNGIQSMRASAYVWQDPMLGVFYGSQDGVGMPVGVGPGVVVDATLMPYGAGRLSIGP